LRPTNSSDSLCYAISTEDVYQDMIKDKHIFDTSEYDPEHPLYSTENKKVLGKMKDETHVIPIQEFVALNILKA
jgi:dTDP-D-glucose 4,6-dehydratase